MNLLELRRAKFAAKSKSQPQAIATQTVATLATDSIPSVAKVAVVAVAEPQKKIQQVLAIDDIFTIRYWLWQIEERSERVIEIILNRCCNEPEALAYYRNRTKEVQPLRKQLDMHGCDVCNNLSPNGICKSATRLGAMKGYRPVLGRLLDHRCPEWTAITMKLLL